jgi:hypothetical protein
MKAFVDSPPGLSMAMTRVANALKRHAPVHVTCVSREADADLVLLHTIGYPETVEAVDRLTAAGKRVVIAQYCLRTSQRPHVQDWLPVWTKADLVWSYYDLVALAREDGIDLCVPGPGWIDCGLYYSPLGVDPSVFVPPANGATRPFTMCTSGYLAGPETVDECSAAVQRVGGRLFHLGPSNVAQGAHVTAEVGIPDSALVARYGESQFVAGLRRIEGFELPALEGLMCGARPIAFDRPHYRAWFEDFAEYIPETTSAEMTDALEALFRAGARPVSAEERARAVKTLAWERIVGDFWYLIGRAA